MGENILLYGFRSAVKSFNRQRLLNRKSGNFLLACTMAASNSETFQPKNALILSKFSRYEFERRRKPSLSEEELIEKLRKRGSDYNNLIKHHHIHCQSRDDLKAALDRKGINTRLVNRLEYTKENIDWADVIFTTGGDGTFLMAASKVNTPDKPIIGINSDPQRSLGYLCLPQHCTTNLDETLNQLCRSDFQWSFRQRIRITIEGENALDDPIELHNQQLMYPEYRYLELDNVNLRGEESINTNGTQRVTLPVRALNEVFVGETLSSRVSYYEFQIDQQPRIKLKSSGLTISTGTGSTSWSFNISRVTTQTIKSLLKIVEDETAIKLPISDDALINQMTKRFNNSLIFDGSRPIMGYTVRDPVLFGNEMNDTRGYAKKIEVRSRMFDACIVVDGGLSYKFNDGAIAKFEIFEEDRLKTVISL